MSDLHVVAVDFIDPNDREAGILVRFDRAIPPYGFEQVQYPGRCLCGALEHIVKPPDNAECAPGDLYYEAVRLGATAADDLIHLGFYMEVPSE